MELHKILHNFSDGEYSPPFSHILNTPPRLICMCNMK